MEYLLIGKLCLAVLSPAVALYVYMRRAQLKAAALYSADKAALWREITELRERVSVIETQISTLEKQGAAVERTLEVVTELRIQLATLAEKMQQVLDQYSK